MRIQEVTANALRATAAGVLLAGGAFSLILFAGGVGEHAKAQTSGRAGVLKNAKAHVLDDETGTLYTLDIEGPVRMQGTVLVEGTLTAPPANLSDQYVLHQTLGTTTNTLRNMVNTQLSSGLTTGGQITTATYNTVAVSAGSGFIRASDSDTSDVLWFDFAANASIEVTSGTKKFIGVEYNAGSPQIAARATDTWSHTDEWSLGNVVNDGLHLHVENNSHLIANGMAHVLWRFYETHPRARDARGGGLIIGETGTRNLTLSAGALWDRVTRFPITALDTSVAGHFHTYYHVAGAWTEAQVTAWPNEQYDNGTDLVTMTNNRYGTLWFYVDTNGEVDCLYGSAEYVTAAQAEQASPPTTLPDIVQEQGVLAARLIYQKSAGTATSIASRWETVFTLSSSHDRSHPLNGTSDHTMTATENNVFTADANGLPKDSTVAIGDLALASALHDRSHPLDSTSDHTGTLYPNYIVIGNANGLPADGGIDLADLATDAEVASHAANANAHHLQIHAIDSTSNHSGTITEDNVVTGDANGLLQDSTVAIGDLATDAELATHTALPGAHHARQHSINDGSDHTGVLVNGNVVIGSATGLFADGAIALADMSTDAELATHASDSTSVHGITDTSDLVTAAASLTNGYLVEGSGSQGVEVNPYIASGAVGLTLDDNNGPSPFVKFIAQTNEYYTIQGENTGGVTIQSRPNGSHFATHYGYNTAGAGIPLHYIGESYSLENASSNQHAVGYIRWLYTDATQGSEDSRCQIAVVAASGFSVAAEFEDDLDFISNGDIGCLSSYTFDVTAAAGHADLRVDSNGFYGIDPSSRRFKINIRDLPTTDSARLLALRPRLYDRKHGKRLDEPGLIAEEVAQVYPDAVMMLNESTSDDPVVKPRPYAVTKSRLIVPMLAQLIEKDREIRVLRARVNAQKNRMDSLEARLEALEAHHP